MPAAGQGQAPRLRAAGNGNAENAWGFALQIDARTGISLGRGDRSKGKCPMLETNVKIDHEAILRQARQLRAEALSQMVRNLISFFRRKPAVRGAAKA
ncbi:hypothetical protein CUR21_07150 [Pseudorhodobacter sp. MZDSW-24AT]|nr:hypothetical protein CUR21_07150 [Pseudorhodobacter sp. MZDSW-24AT]